MPFKPNAGLGFCRFRKKMYIGQKDVFLDFRGRFFALKTRFYLRSYFAFYFLFELPRRNESPNWNQANAEASQKA